MPALTCLSEHVQSISAHRFWTNLLILGKSDSFTQIGGRGCCPRKPTLRARSDPYTIITCRVACFPLPCGFR